MLTLPSRNIEIGFIQYRPHVGQIGYRKKLSLSWSWDSNVINSNE
jgi:hypothetical protein